MWFCVADAATLPEIADKLSRLRTNAAGRHGPDFVCSRLPDFKFDSHMEK